jgi:large subunit ribosomal protein L29
MTDEELVKKLGESRQELFKLRFQAATGALDSSARLQRARREIARILTIQNERAAEKV